MGYVVLNGNALKIIRLIEWRLQHIIDTSQPKYKTIVIYHMILYLYPYWFYYTSMTWQMFQNPVFQYCLLMTLIYALPADIWEMC